MKNDPTYKSDMLKITIIVISLILVFVTIAVV